jgi:valyl-tRNA synthetase
MQQLTKFFEFEKKEKEIHKKWDELKIYSYNKSHPENTFSIDTPPPTVSGYLHMGHVFSYVQADIIARYNRISGKNVFYPVGFDDNGLPTERLVEKQTGKKVGINCTKQEFEEECFKVVEDVEQKFEELFRGIGISYDWSLKYQTISKKTEEIVLQSFADLHQKGLVYLKDAPVYWDTEDKTALAQADLEDKELESVEYFIPFQCSKTGKVVEVMTTRPELLVSCVAVLHHPGDKRFKGITTLKTPFFGEEVPLLADDVVKQDKGTGVVMCCSYGDWTDVEWIKKHKLTPKVLTQENGEIHHNFYKNEETGKYLRVVNARTKLVDEMQKHGLILKQNKIMHSVKCGERSGKPVEIINQRQMYIKTIPFKKFLLQATQELEFTPSHMKIRLEKWIEGLNQDWCISRNRFFGIEIPYYTCELNGKNYEFIFQSGVYKTTELLNVQKTADGYSAVYSGENTELKNKKIDLKFHYVFDTWFTSSLTPQIANNSLKYENLPFNLRPQAHEIIRTWTFYTLLKSVLHASNTNGNGIEIANIDGQTFHVEHNILKKQQYLPWKTVGLSGWCLASDKSKMSKSKGNIVEPLALVQKHGADVVRFWCSNTPLGTDSAYSEDRLDLGKKFTTKLWNTIKFALQNEIPQKPNIGEIVNEVDFWIINELKKAITEYKIFMEKMDYFHARKTLDNFFWSIFCDNYLEFIKIRYYGIKAFIYKDVELLNDKIQKINEEQKSAITTLCIILHGITILYSPFCPFICEEVGLILFKKGGVSKQGSLNDFLQLLKNTQQLDTERELKFQKHLEVVEAFRRYKTEGRLNVFYVQWNDIIVNLPYDISTYILQLK